MGKLEESAKMPIQSPKKRTGELSAIDGRLLKAPERSVFGDNVRAGRNALGLSLTDMAHLIEADRAYIGKVEHGKINVSIDRMSSIAALFNVHLHELLQPEFALSYKNIRSESSQTHPSKQLTAPAKGRRRSKDE
ncbi:helix-turn-helix domain-containing protein [Acidiphilium sp. PM]|uniref:helix-turn-helix domain-containing protein n=1 Tax=Acidiphilium sp. PM TaxID=1043206 RepID=UPI000A03CAC8|nr:helix-turn-helix transcriptional regulator [Acidiphilium sp. PM]